MKQNWLFKVRVRDRLNPNPNPNPKCSSSICSAVYPSCSRIGCSTRVRVRDRLNPNLTLTPNAAVVLVVSCTHLEAELVVVLGLG